MIIMHNEESIGDVDKGEYYLPGGSIQYGRIGMA